jgi:hypothetical protein
MSESCRRRLAECGIRNKKLKFVCLPLEIAVTTCFGYEGFLLGAVTKITEKLATDLLPVYPRLSCTSESNVL